MRLFLAVSAAAALVGSVRAENDRAASVADALERARHFQSEMLAAAAAGGRRLPAALSQSEGASSEAVHGHGRAMEGEMCTLCAGGGEPTNLKGNATLFGEEISCMELQAMEAAGGDEVPLADDPLCTVVQLVTFTYCGCPEAPALPTDDEDFCTVCPDGTPVSKEKLGTEVDTGGLESLVDPEADEDDPPLTCGDAQIAAASLSLDLECEPGCMYENDEANEDMCKNLSSQADCDANEMCFYEDCEGINEQGRRSTRRSLQFDDLFDPSDFCPILQGFFAETCGCSTVPERTCIVCPFGLVDPSLGTTNPLNQADTTCGALLTAVEFLPATVCSTIESFLPILLPTTGCECKEEADPTTTTAAPPPTTVAAASPTEPTTTALPADGVGADRDAQPDDMQTNSPAVQKGVGHTFIAAGVVLAVAGSAVSLL